MQDKNPATSIIEGVGRPGLETMEMLSAVEEPLESPRVRPGNHNISIHAVTATPRVAFQAETAPPPAQGSFSCPPPTSRLLWQIQRQSWVHVSNTWLKMLCSLFMETT